MPIIGKNTIGPITTSTFNRSFGTVVAAQSYTAVAGDVVDQFFIHAGVNTTNPLVIDIAIYTYVAGLPAVRLAAPVTITINSTTVAWYSSALVNQPLTPGVTYCIAWKARSDFFVTRISCANCTSQDVTGPLPATWTHFFFFGVNWDCYANVTNTPPATGILRPCCAQLIT